MYNTESLFIVNPLKESFGKMMGYDVEGQGSIPGREKRFLSTESRPALGPTHPPIQWVPVALFPEVKRPRSEADN
jgi:hypothetical protein